MNINIKDIAWGIDRKSGEKLEKEVCNVTFEATIGETIGIGTLNKVFSITEITNDSVTFVLNNKGNTIIIKKGTEYIYRPRTFDGGHYYIINVL